MRLNVSRIGLLACMARLASAEQDPKISSGADMPAGSPSNAGQTPVIEFPGDQFSVSSNIFRASVTNKVLTWVVRADTTATPSVKRVGLLKGDGKTLATATPTPSGSLPNTAVFSGAQPTTTIPSGGAPGGGNRNLPSTSTAIEGGLAGVTRMLMPRDDSIFPLNVKFETNQVTLELSTSGGVRQGTTISNNDYTTHDAWETLLYLVVEWADDQHSGRSYSPAFMVTNTTFDDRIPVLVGQLTGNVGGKPFKSEEIVSLGADTTRPATLTPTLGGTAATSAPASSAESAGGSGLATGAIIGIAVGVGVVALAAIGFAVWFFIRRRRNQRGGVHYPVGYSSDGAADGAVGGRGKWDKEVPMVTTESPQSRYGPDAASTRLHDHRSSMVASGHHDDDATSYAPYSDSAPTPGTRGVAAAGGAAAGAASAAAPTASQTDLREGGTRSPTPPIATRYAHLVEEGMTEDEIRRLEEEERALDAAIEDAGRTSRAA